jgi:hypothetical protein
VRFQTRAHAVSAVRAFANFLYQYRYVLVLGKVFASVSVIQSVLQPARLSINLVHCAPQGCLMVCSTAVLIAMQHCVGCILSNLDAVFICVLLDALQVYHLCARDML